MIQIHYYGSIRAAAGKKEETLEYSPETTIFRLLEALADSRGGEFRDELMDCGELREDIGISLNGTLIRHEAAEEIHVNPGDTLALLPLLLGGG